MSKLRNYELSFWRDVIINNEPQEQRLYVFGADSLTTLSRALEPKLKRNVNGSNELTFKMYYQYIDNITGEKVDNPFCKDLINEAKIKLHFLNKWYDMIIKGVDKKTSNKTITYTATDLHINELSKNGFGLTLDTKTETSIGTIEELANRIFEDTDWLVDTSEKIPQTIDETLVEVRILQDFYATQLRNDITEAPTELPNQLIPADSIIYLFYSCCKNKSDRLLFVYVADTIEKDLDRIIVNKNSLYYVDGITYVETSTSKKYGLFLPNNLCGNIPTMKISSEYRGARFVFSAKSLFNKTLDKYVTVYRDLSGKEWHGYTETELVAPVLILNLVTNNDFKTDTGWYGRYWFDMEKYGKFSSYLNKGLLYNAGVLCSNTNTTTGQDTSMMGDLLNGQYLDTDKYKSYIRLDFKGANLDTCSSVVINSGFYDLRSSIKNLSPNQKFILLYHIKNSENVVPPNFTVYVGEADYYAVADAQNSIFRNGSFLEFNSNEAKSMDREDKSYLGYRYAVASVSSNYHLTQDEFGRTKTQIFIVPDDPSVDSILELFDFQIFPYIEKEGEFTKSDDKILLPEDGAKEIRVRTNYCYFDPLLPQNKEASKKEQMSISIYHDKPRSDLLYQYSVGAEKVATLNVSKSNYFNACQKLCEVFECWADFDIVHDDEGYIIEKWVRFKNYIGQDNFAGFRYGVNLKDISRKDDSKKIVSKLMVTSNTNKHAKNGYCAIGRAGSNETGEDYIYDFTYYINQKMLNPTDLVDLFYDTDNGQGLDLDLILPTHPGINEPINCQGYYTRLQKLNTEMNKISEEMSKYSNLIMEAKKNITTYEASLEQIRSLLADDINGFRQTTGFDYTEISSKEETKAERQNLVLLNASVRSYLIRITTGLSSERDYTKKLQDAEKEFEEYSTNYELLEVFFENRRNQKKSLNLEFFKKYYRFIQEGTWTDNDQVDDEKYYNDAISVAYNSSMPQVSYTFNALALENIEGYEGFNLLLADKTFIEDTEYFGYDEKGNPYRELVVITEITYSLEEINKDSYKIQNYKNQFQDLFQTITASVQNVNYTSGAWNNAADFTEASDAKKSSFLQGALNHADTVLSNMGEQSVVWNEKGITITDNLHPSQQLRIIAGGIFLRDQDDKDLGWKAGITPQGINAKLITAGQLNTGIIQIMNGDEPYFRWDDHGITAYDFLENKVGYTTTYNTKKGVRFDRFGIYGYDMTDGNFNVEGDTVVDGLTWHPTSVKEIRDNSIFSLTWEGLLLKIGTGLYFSNESINDNETILSVITHHSFASMGKIDDKMYYGWKEDDPWEPDDTKHNTNDTGFVKVFSAGITGEDGIYEERMAIFDNGTLLCKYARIEGALDTTQGKIGGWDINEDHIKSFSSPTPDKPNLPTGCIFLNSAKSTSNNWIEAYNTAEPTDTGLKFSISKVGKLTAKNATIEGTITATSGFIGEVDERGSKGWTITGNGFYGITSYYGYDTTSSHGLALARWVHETKDDESLFYPVLAIGFPGSVFEDPEGLTQEDMGQATFCINENGYGKWGFFTMEPTTFRGNATITLNGKETHKNYKVIYQGHGLECYHNSAPGTPIVDIQFSTDSSANAGVIALLVKSDSALNIGLSITYSYLDNIPFTLVSPLGQNLALQATNKIQLGGALVKLFTKHASIEIDNSKNIKIGTGEGDLFLAGNNVYITLGTNKYQITKDDNGFLKAL